MTAASIGTKCNVFQRKKWSPENERNFLDWLGNQLGFKQMDHWYHITHHQIDENGGGGLLNKYENSNINLVMFVYSGHHWSKELFHWSRSKLSEGHWDSGGNRASLVNQLAKRLNIKELGDWYRISSSQINGIEGCSGLLENYPLEKLLPEVYSDHQWDLTALSGKGRYATASQRWLRTKVQEIFPQAEIIENYRHSKLRYESGLPMELDIYLPKEQLSFEYQGEHHYRDIWSLGSFWQQELIDKEKRKACKDNEITLVEVPYWWDKEASSLAATVQRERENLILYRVDGEPIPTLENHLGHSEVSLMHGVEWNGITSLDGWWMSEKLDGVRAYWNGSNLVSRNGMKVSCPNWFVEGLPKAISLDGELWAGRGTFEILRGTLKSSTNPEWKRTYFMVFDLPNSRENYETRSLNLANQYLPNHAQLVNVIRCRGNSHVRRCFATIVNYGGEGLIVNKRGSLYALARTEELLKVKLLSDVEVKLLGVVPNGLYCEQSNGLKCIVRFDQQSFNSTPIGSLLTVKHSGYLKNGTLRNPFYWRSLESLQPMNQMMDWREQLNHRELFDTIGSRLNLKKLEDFYMVSLNDIKEFGGNVLLNSYFDDSLTHMLSSIYPHYPWHEWSFSYRMTPNFWGNEVIHREFLDWLGVRLNFKEMDHWYGVTVKQIRENGGGRLLSKYGGSRSKLVIAVYHTHDWQKSKFYTTRGYWDDKNNQRSFLLSLGNQLGFRNMDDWYSITKRVICENGGSGLMSKHGSSPSKLVMGVFDTYSWQQSNFSPSSLQRAGKSRRGSII